VTGRREGRGADLPETERTSPWVPWKGVLRYLFRLVRQFTPFILPGSRRMAQATRSAPSTARLSDDPIESVSTWFQTNSRLIGGIVGGAAAVALLIFGYRSYTGSTREKASIALYAAQEPYAQGKNAEAQAALEKVVTRYGNTAAGQQASILLAQLFYEQQKPDEGIKAAEKALGSATSDFRASLESMIAAGYELKGNWMEAAAHYGKAASAAPFAAEKHQFEASQARSLMAAGKNAEARKLWESLALLDGNPVQQEANVRLGELSATP
jgi:predicted negative regulator of RcsB-dependent stress response